MLDKLFFISLVLNATGLFRFIAPQLGASSIAQVSLALLVFNSFYLICRFRYLCSMLPRMLPWLVLLLVWPLATLAYAPATEWREVGLAAYGATLLAGTIVYTASNGLSSMHRVFLVALVLTVFGEGLNILRPAYFEDVAVMADARVLAIGRPGGFFLQPNRLGVGLVMIFVGWLALAPRHTRVRESAMTAIFLGAVLLTGSRAGIALALVIIGAHLTCQWWGKISGSRTVRRLSTRLAVLAACIFFVAAGAKLFTEVYRGEREPNSWGLVERVGAFLQFQLTRADTVWEDRSLQVRFAAQRVYWDLVKQRPLLGYGLGAEVWYREHGALWRASHSTIFSAILDYGVLHPVLFFGLLGMAFFNRHRRSVERALGTNTIAQFAVLAGLMCVFSGGLFDRRVFFILLGMVCAALYYPQAVFHWDEAAGTYRRPLSAEEIRHARRGHEGPPQEPAR